MERNSINILLLKTAFCCMACDGEITSDEVELIRTICKENSALQEVDFETEIKQFIAEINIDSKKFLSDFFKTIEEKAPDLTEQEEFDLIDIAIKVLKADNKIEYSEIKFFKAIRYCLKTEDDRVISYFSRSVEDIDLFLGEDIHTATKLDDLTKQYFNASNIDIIEMLD